MKKIVFLLLSILVSFHLLAVVEETASFKAFLYGSAPSCQYDNWISHISEGIAIPNYNLYAPFDRQLTGFGAYVTPNASELSVWETAVSSFINGDLEVAQTILTNNNMPYTVVIFHDTDTGRQYNMLRENLNLTYVDNNNTPDDPNDDEIGSFSKGWGLYVCWPDAPQPVIVDVCHPTDDFIAPPVAYRAFVEWQGKYLLIAGAGREVLWSTSSPPYTNSKSLSDPSRIANHPFSKAYALFCDNVRTQFNTREFSAQIHSYDWNRHAGYPSLQLSVGNTRTNPNLPTRDLSSSKHDMLNTLGHVVFPQNSIGVHSQVDLDDYISVWYDTYPFTVVENDSSVQVSNYIDLPGFLQNVQQNKSWENWSDWDRFDPFFHIEMDELPNCYTQNTNNYYWFYGYDPQTGTYNREKLFDNAVEYYSKWVDGMATVIPEMTANNDNQIPTTPQNFAKVSDSFNYIRLGWDPIDSYDFYSYEILYATQPLTETNYTVFDRTNNSELGSLLCNQISVTGLLPNQNYYFKIRAKDYNNNVSDLSPQVVGTTGPANIDQVYAFGNENKITVKWLAVTQNQNQGFKIERKSGSSNFVQIADWNSTPSLVGNTASNVYYSYDDANVSNNTVYTYRISAVNASNFITPHYYQPQAQLQPVYTLYLNNQSNTMTDSLKFSKNMFATDGKNTNFDIVRSSSVSGDYVFAAFYEQYWSNYGDYLNLETYGDYNTNNEYKVFVIKAKSNQLNQPLTFSVSNNFNRNTEKLYLRDLTTGVFTNLETTDYSFTVANANERTFQLIWGNFQPTPTVSEGTNRVYRSGNAISFAWTVGFSFLNSSIDLYLKNDTDSLFVASNLAADATTFQFNVPDNRTLHYAKLYVRCNAQDGEHILAESPYTIGILPSTLSFDIQNGLNLISNPFYQNLVNVNQFGPNAVAYTFLDSIYTTSTQLSHNVGYALNTQSSYNLNLSYQIFTEEIQKTLNIGWNLLGNPHYCPYNVKDLKFVLGPNTYTYGELLQQEILGPNVYVYRDGKYMSTSVINPYESFFIYSRQNTDVTLQCIFTPYNLAGANIEKNSVWEAKILAEQTGIDTDEIIIGSTFNKNSSIDIEYDSPEPPKKPNMPNLSFYIPVDPVANEYGFSKLNTYFVQPFTTTEAEFKEVDFKINITDLAPITFTVDRSKFPTNYSARIVINNEEHIIHTNGSYTYAPSAVGLVSGKIRIGNEFVSNQDVTAKPLSLKAYPNPFNPNTNLFFNLPKSGKVELAVYNIKGQKVRSLVNETLKAGDHTIIWNGKDNRQKSCASNIYFVRLKVNGKTTNVKKITLLK